MSWSVPAEWPGERCFILAGGESLKAQRAFVPRLQGRVIAIKHSMVLKPDADVMLVSGRDDPKVCRGLFPKFKGARIISRHTYPGFPPNVLLLKRTQDPTRLSDDPRQLAGLDAGASAINLAYLFGSREIILLGYDQQGGRWLNGEIRHHLPYPPQEHFDRHLRALGPLAEDLKARGVRVVNCSPTSAVECFEKQPLEAFV